jgi:ribonuclease VapC
MRMDGMALDRTSVLDASALLAMLHDEPGGEKVQSLLETAIMSSINWSEVVQKALEWQADVGGLRQDLESLGLEIVPFSAGQAEGTARLRASTRHLGLSLADRACLTLAAEAGLPAVTTDKIWRDIDSETEIRVIR